MTSNFSNSARIAATLLLFAPLGCKARELGSSFADEQSPTVDNTWVTAVVACWPAMAHQGYSIEGIKHYLADPLHFRAAFAVYAPLDDGTLRAIVAVPVSRAPMPDTSLLMQSQSPVISRIQAMSGATSSVTSVPGPDSLCSIQPGLPVGFR
jgi:hypothetical protein